MHPTMGKWSAKTSVRAVHKGTFYSVLFMKIWSNKLHFGLPNLVGDCVILKKNIALHE